jgi:hypothetical protein
VHWMDTLGKQQFNIHEETVKEDGDLTRFHGLMSLLIAD